MCVTMSCSQSIFLLTNYIRSVPADLEEAASIDGCTTFGAYWRVVVPLIKPMTMTILVLNVLWVWNDFQMPLIILNRIPAPGRSPCSSTTSSLNTLTITTWRLPPT